jgi:shikimate dehydrogenase
MTKKYGIIGYPLGHSISPQIHNMAFEYHKINGSYEKIEILPENFDNEINRLKSENWSGFNVTIPYKELILKYVDEIDPISKVIGAINTIKRMEDDTWAGYNTDYIGFLNPIRNAQNDISSCLILGAGGSARAVCFGLVTQFKIDELVIINRTKKRAEQLKNDLHSIQAQNVTIGDFDALQKINEKFDLIVNTTSVGMGKMSGQMPINPTFYSKNDTIVYDLIYNPMKTAFLITAEGKVKKCINGLAMLISQAEASFKIWTNIDFSGGLSDMIYTNLVQKLQ